MYGLTSYAKDGAPIPDRSISPANLSRRDFTRALHHTFCSRRTFSLCLSRRGSPTAAERNGPFRLFRYLAYLVAIAIVNIKIIIIIIIICGHYGNKQQ